MNATALRQKMNTTRLHPKSIFPRSFFAGLLTETIRNGGTTNIFPRTVVQITDLKVLGEPRYVVGNGTEGTILTVPDFCRNVDLESFLDELLTLWKLEGYDGFGTWRNENTVYIDPVVLFYSKLHAFKLARRHNETCIYDLQTKKTVYV